MPGSAAGQGGAPQGWRRRTSRRWGPLWWRRAQLVQVALAALQARRLVGALRRLLGLRAPARASLGPGERERAWVMGFTIVATRDAEHVRQRVRPDGARGPASEVGHWVGATRRRWSQGGGIAFPLDKCRPRCPGRA